MYSKPIEAPGGRSFAATIKYIRGQSKDFEKEEKIESELTRNIENIEDAAIEMQAVADTGKSQHAAYHYVLTWPEGEKPTPEQLEACLDQSLKALGMSDLQAVAGFHRDTDNYHLHVCVNRIDYRTGLIRPIDQDKMTLDKASREMELQHGWSHWDKGAYIVNDKGEIVRKSHDPNRPVPLDRKNKRMEIETGEKSFKTWTKDRAGKELTTAVAAGSWDELHRTAAKYNLEIRPDPKNQGLVIVDRTDPELYHAKASEIARQLSRGRLESVLGPYQEPAAQVKELAPLIDYKNDSEKMLAIEPEQKQLYQEHKEYEQKWKSYGEDRKAITDELKKARKEIIDWKKEQVKALKESDLSGMEKRAKRAEINLEAARRKAAIEATATEKRAALGEYGEPKKGFDKYLSHRAAQGNEAAIYMLRQKKSRLEVEAKEPGTAGEEEAAKKTTLNDLEIKVSRHGNVSFLDKSGAEAYRDTGRQLLFLGHSKNDPAAIRAGLLLSREKFGNKFELTGSMEWKKLAAAQAVELGITITNKELQPYIAELQKAKEAPEKPARATEARKPEKTTDKGHQPTVTPATEPLPQIEREYTTAQLLPEIRDEIKIVNETIAQNEAWLAKSGRPIEGATARRDAEKSITRGVSERIRQEREAIQAETLKLAATIDDRQQRGLDPNSEQITAAANDLATRTTRNTAEAVRLENYLKQPEVQKQIEAYVAKVEANNRVIRDVQGYTAELKEYRADLKKVENTLANDPKKDRAYKLEAGTDPRSRQQIMKDPTFRQQVNAVQKQLDQTKAKAKGIER